MTEAKFNAPKSSPKRPSVTTPSAAGNSRHTPPSSTSNDIIKLLDLEDENVEISGPEVKDDHKILTISKVLEPTYCPICDTRMHSRGVYTRTVNHPVLQGGLPLVLKVRQRSWKCINPACGNTLTDEFSFVKPGKRNTTASDLSIVWAFKDLHLTVKQIAERYNVSDTYAATAFARYVDMKPRQLTEAISIDEVEVDISKKLKYAAVLQDFTTGEPIDLIPGRRKEVLREYFEKRPPGERKNVRYLISDMYRPYVELAGTVFPNAVSAVDSFHVVKLIVGKLRDYINDLVQQQRLLDEIRHRELEQEFGRRIKRLPHSKKYFLLVNYKWLILKNHDDIIYPAQPKYIKKLGRDVTLGEIEEMLFEIDPDLRELRNLKERYIRFNRDYGNRSKAARPKLRELIQVYRQSEYPMFHDIADTLEKYFESIANSFIMVERLCYGETHITRLSNGPMEGMNHLVKDVRRNGHGYRNFENLRNRFLFARRENAHILGTPKSVDQVKIKTGVKRGPYKKSDAGDSGQKGE